MEETESKPIFSPKWGRIILILVLAACCAAGYFAYLNRSYTGFSIQERIERKSVETTDYRSFEGNLFSYSRDGASLADFDGNPIWNESFDMENPTCDQSDDYLLVYDRERTGAIVLNADGLKGKLSMTLPIVRACVAGNGNVAVLMQDEDTAYLRLFTASGKTIASGEVHAENTGYPLAMDLSDDATRLVVSLLDLNSGDIQTTVCFYDFSNSKSVDKNHILANFSYSDEIIPELAFLGDDAAVGFADEELIFFDLHKKVTARKRIALADEVQAVFYSKERAAIITSHEMDGGGKNNLLHVYTKSGQEKFFTRISGNMSYAGFMDNGEILLHNGHQIRIFRDDGKKKLSTKSEENISAVIPWDGQRNYYFITKNQTQKVVLQ